MGKGVQTLQSLDDIERDSASKAQSQRLDLEESKLEDLAPALHQSSCRPCLI